MCVGNTAATDAFLLQSSAGKRPCQLQYIWLYEDCACLNHLIVSLNQSKSAATAFKPVLAEDCLRNNKKDMDK